MNTIRRTEEFIAWISKLKDVAGKARIAARLKMAAAGNFGDHKSVGQGVMEMRIHTGPGYRVYYAQEGDTVYILLIGGDKSTQDKDIKKAHELWKEIKEG